MNLIVDTSILWTKPAKFLQKTFDFITETIKLKIYWKSLAIETYYCIVISDLEAKTISLNELIATELHQKEAFEPTFPPKPAGKWTLHRFNNNREHTDGKEFHVHGNLYFFLTSK